MSAPQVSFPEGMSLRLKREEPIQGGEDGVFLPLALQIGSSGHAICQAMRGNAHGPGGMRAHGHFSDTGPCFSVRFPISLGEVIAWHLTMPRG